MTEAAKTHPLAKPALEIAPLAAFFIAYRFAGGGEQGLIPATVALMIATSIAVAGYYWLFRKAPVMPLVTLVVVLIFGGLTLWFHDTTFIKMKPTIVNGLFAGALLGGLAFGKSLIRIVLGEAISLSDEGWRRITWVWAAFFVLMAVVNEVVWRNFSADVWANFKTYGSPVIAIIFSIAMTPLLSKYQTTDE